MRSPQRALLEAILTKPICLTLRHTEHPYFGRGVMTDYEYSTVDKKETLRILLLIRKKTRILTSTKTGGWNKYTRVVIIASLNDDQKQ